MKSFRTDLAIELNDIHSKQLEGINLSEEKFNDLKISKVDIQTEEASFKIGKPIGVYYTVDIPPLKNFVSLNENEIELISQKIKTFLSLDEKLVLVVGLGNRDITPDSLGPRTISKIISTRHIKLDIELNDKFHHLNSVAAIAPGVLGQTGIEISEIIKSLVDKIRPNLVIVVDALVSQNINRLGSTIQISNSGISPGSGVMNPRKEISQDILGVPIISIGVPTVVDAKTLVKDMSDEKESDFKPMIVTPKEIDNIIKNASDILSLIINKTLQNNLSIDEIKSLISS